jgi:signal transduction histidine kinase
VTIKIIDTGAGISPEGQSKLFMDFGKLDENAHLNREGTGLGFSICKKIIEQQGGTVTVRSRVDKGTMFTINLGTNCRLRD